MREREKTEADASSKKGLFLFLSLPLYIPLFLLLHVWQKGKQNGIELNNEKVFHEDDDENDNA
jgi:hypothetical protein